MADLDPRQQAVANSRGEDYAQTMATVYVGDQIARLADLLQGSVPPAVYFEAVEVPHGDGGLSPSGWVPGEMVVGKKR